jgi:hypothetical protein
MDLESARHSVRIEHLEERRDATLVFWIEPAADRAAPGG